MTGPSLAQLIGDRILDDDLVADALHAYHAEHTNGVTVQDCAVHLVRLALMAPSLGWIASRQVTEYVASPKLERHLAAKEAKAAAPKRRQSRLRIVPPPAESEAGR